MAKPPRKPPTQAELRDEASLEDSPVSEGLPSHVDEDAEADLADAYAAFAEGDGPFGDGDDIPLGEEATVPLGEFASIQSRLPVADAQSPEWRELARRFDAARTPAFPIDNRRKLPLEPMWRRWRAFAMRGRSDVVDDFGHDPRATATWERRFEFLYRHWFRVTTSGLDNIPASGPAILVANHAGALPYDTVMLMHAVRRDHAQRRDVRPLVEDPVFHLPFLGPLMNRIGGVRAAPENAERLLANRELIAVFPEGVKGMGKLWKDRYKLQRFGRGGFVRLALRTGAPIIPVAIVGAEEATPMMGKVTWFTKNLGLPWVPITPTFPTLGPAGLLPLPSKWHIAFGEPLHVGQRLGAAAADDRLLVNGMADEIRSTIQTMIDSLRGRHSPWPNPFRAAPTTHVP